jgi:LPS-assembly protein
MLHRLGFFVLLWTSSFLTGWTRAQPSQSEWNVEGLTEESVVEQDLETGKVKAFNGVKVIYEGAVLTADRMQLDRRTGEVMAVGDVYLQQENQIWAGDRLEYNFKTRELRTGRFRTGRPPVYAAGEGLYMDRNTGTYVATNSFVTTDNVSDPAFRVKAGEMKVKPGDEIEAKNAIFYLGKVPSMYFPYYQRELFRIHIVRR